MSSFPSFIHSLLSQGILPGKSFQVIIFLNDGRMIGKHVNITSNDPIFNCTPKKVILSSLTCEYTITHSNNEWTVKEWIRPENNIASV